MSSVGTRPSAGRELAFRSHPNLNAPDSIETDAREPEAGDGAAIVGSERRLRPRRADLVTEWPRVSVIIPTINEEQNLPHVLTKLPGRLHEVIIVDGFSEDRTLDVARLLRPDAKIVLQQCPGKGDALRCGFEARSEEHTSELQSLRHLVCR